jgi:hypothetical protein
MVQQLVGMHEAHAGMMQPLQLGANGASSSCDMPSPAALVQSHKSNLCQTLNNI